MAWLFKRGNVWWIGWRVNGRQFLKSTEQEDKAEADKVLTDYNAVEAAAKANRLNHAFVESFSTSTAPSMSLKRALDSWLKEMAGTVAETTLPRYRRKLTHLAEFLKATETSPLLRDITTEDIIRFTAKKRAEQKAGTVNDGLCIVKGFFKRCVELGWLHKSPAQKVKFFKIPREEKTARRALTMEEVAKIYAACPDDSWRYMILGAFYTGLRLGDLACLEWRCVDWKSNLLHVNPRKTPDKTIHIPMAKPFKTQLECIFKKRGQSIYIWPKGAELYGKSPTHVNKEFKRKVLSPAGLIDMKAFNKPKGGAKKKQDWISFHYLRHTFVSCLKLSGASQSVAKELAGHSNDAVNDLYTTIPVEVLEKAVNQLPAITP